MICILYSDNINITILDKIAKDHTYRLLSTNELRIFKKNYLVEVLEISLSVQIIKEKMVDNL
jgi:hypothetical protein